MISKLRIWRVVPTNKVGVQAPYFFVETTEEDREKAELKAKELARQKSALSKYDCWTFQLTKESVRKDEFGRYIKHHQ